jgi:hypothetical protein
MANQFLDEFSLTEKPSGSVISIVDKEIHEPLEETPMLLWDSNHPIPFTDTCDGQGCPAEILAIQTSIKIQPIQINPTATHHLEEIKWSITPKHQFLPKDPTNIHTWEMPKLDYNVVEDMKKMKASVSVMDIYGIPQQNYFLLQALKLIDTPMKSIYQGDVPSPKELTNKPSVNSCYL